MSSTSVESELKYVTYTFAGRKKVINTVVPRLHRTPFQLLYKGAIVFSEHNRSTPRQRVNYSTVPAR